MNLLRNVDSELLWTRTIRHSQQRFTREISGLRWFKSGPQSFDSGVFVDLVTAPGFKPGETPEKGSGGFDSHPLPLSGFSRSFVHPRTVSHPAAQSRVRTILCLAAQRGVACPYFLNRHRTSPVSATLFRQTVRLLSSGHRRTAFRGQRRTIVAAASNLRAAVRPGSRSTTLARVRQCRRIRAS